MIPEIDQTTLTAYALNELNAEDRAKVESHIAEDPIARQTVGDIQATAAMLIAELAQELQSTPSLPMAMPPAPRRHRWATATIGLAAAAAIAAGIGVYVHRFARPHILAAAVGVATRSNPKVLSVQSVPLQLTATKPMKPLVVNAGIGNGTATNGENDAFDLSASPFAGTQHDNIFTGQAGANAAVTVNGGQISQSPQAKTLDGVDSILLPQSEQESIAAASSVHTTTQAKRFSPVAITQNQVTDNTTYRDANGSVVASSQSGSRTLDWITNVGNAAVPGSDSATPKGYDARMTVQGNVSGLNYYHSGNTRPGTGGYNDYSTKAGSTDTETYNSITDNPFLSSRRAPLSTFAVDVDTASYSNVRRFIEQGQLPPADAVRIQDLINYFPYNTTGPKPTDADPVAVNVEVADCPWQPAHRLARIALKAKSLAEQKRPPSNLVFLIDVSGSMADENKLPLLKQAIKKLVNRLAPTDRVSIVTYAGKAQMTLESTACGDDPIDKSITGRQQILDAIDSLNADGETNGGDGIQLAYKTAVSGFLKEGVNRVILATDGDFNVGIVDPNQLTALIDKEATTGVYLTVLGLGMGNVKDSTMEKLANHGKGNYAYLDSLDEADKVLGRQINATLVTVAKDVKLQVEFNPATVAAYRLIGYEDRAMPNKDFKNDQKTAGEMGAGHSVVALYELIPANGLATIQPLKYQPAPPPSTNPTDHELMTVNVRYQPPQGGESRKLEVPVIDQPEASANASSDFRFTAAVASFGMILRNSPYRGDSTLDQVIVQATAARGEDVGRYRAQFIELATRAKSLCGK